MFDDWIFVFISILIMLVLYYTCICCLSGAAVRKENCSSANEGDELPEHEPYLRQNTSYHIDPDEGICGVIQGPTIVETLFPQVQGENVMKKYGTSLVLSWFLDLSFLQKMSLVWNIVDIGTDAYFGTTIREVHTELFYISIVSILCSTASFCTMIYLDMCLFAADSDKLFRRALRLRWGIFVFVPLEDIVMIILAIYIFVLEGRDDAAFLSIAVSILSIIFLHFLKAVLEERGFLQVTSKKKERFAAATIELENIAQE